jgi:hypothetical protein
VFVSLQDNHLLSVCSVNGLRWRYVNCAAEWSSLALSRDGQLLLMGFANGELLIRRLAE